MSYIMIEKNQNILLNYIHSANKSLIPLQKNIYYFTLIYVRILYKERKIEKKKGL